jgi:predicted nucleotidyltransferase component of viral defense system
MKTLTTEQRELIDAVVAERDIGQLTAAILEKDIHVTDVLKILADIRHDHLELVFCGGTCLSKAHGLIQRMSEDLDFKMALREGHGLSKTQLREHLGTLKNTLANALTEQGFAEIDGSRIAQNENQFFAYDWEYQSQFAGDNSLRPHLKLEFTARTPLHGYAPRPIRYLVNQLANRDGIVCDIPSISLEETFAEKVLSFLRRYGQQQAELLQQRWDEALVRHIYDVYCLVQNDAGIVDRAALTITALIQIDINEFGRQYPALAASPNETLLQSLSVAKDDNAIKQQYEEKLLPLIFGTNKPNFGTAFAVFRAAAEQLLIQKDD